MPTPPTTKNVGAGWEGVAAWFREERSPHTKFILSLLGHSRGHSPPRTEQSGGTKYLQMSAQSQLIFGHGQRPHISRQQYFFKAMKAPNSYLYYLLPRPTGRNGHDAKHQPIRCDNKAGWVVKMSKKGKLGGGRAKSRLGCGNLKRTGWTAPSESERPQRNSRCVKFDRFCLCCFSAIAQLSFGGREFDSVDR